MCIQFWVVADYQHNSWTGNYQVLDQSVHTKMFVLLLHSPSIIAVKAKFMECSIINPALLLLMKHLIIGQRQKAPNFSAFLVTIR